MYKRGNRLRKYKKNNIIVLNSVPQETLDSVPLETLDPDMCLICLEPCEETNKLFKMKDIPFLNSHCKCNGNLHVNCLVKWTNVSKTCPICRKQLTINLDILKQVNHMYKTTLLLQFKDKLSSVIFIFVTIVMIFSKYIVFFICVKTCYVIVKQILYNPENRG
jgi:hypothetical protein